MGSRDVVFKSVVMWTYQGMREGEKLHLKEISYTLEPNQSQLLQKDPRDALHHAHHACLLFEVALSSLRFRDTKNFDGMSNEIEGDCSVLPNSKLQLTL